MEKATKPGAVLIGRKEVIRIWAGPFLSQHFSIETYEGLNKASLLGAEAEIDKKSEEIDFSEVELVVIDGGMKDALCVIDDVRKRYLGRIVGISDSLSVRSDMIYAGANLASDEHRVESYLTEVSGYSSD